MFAISLSNKVYFEKENNDLYQKIYPDGLFTDENQLVTGDDDIKIYTLTKDRKTISE